MSHAQKWRLIRLLFLALGLAFFPLLIYRLDPGAIGAELARVGIYIPIIILPYFVGFIFDSIGWRYSFSSPPGVSFNRLFWVRMAGEAMNVVTPAAYLGGEPVKAFLLNKHKIPLVEGASAVVIAKTAMTVAEAIFVIIGAGIALHQVGAGSAVVKGVLLALIALLPLVGLLIFAQRAGLFTRILRTLRKLGLRGRFLDRAEERVSHLDHNLSRYYRENPRGMVLATFYHLVGWVMGVGEVYLILSLMGIPVDLGMAFAIEALGAIIKGAMFFIPASIGTQEGGNVLIFAAYGLSATTSLSFSIIRRIREIIYVVIGLYIFSRYEWKKDVPRAETTPASPEMFER